MKIESNMGQKKWKQYKYRKQKKKYNSREKTQQNLFDNIFTWLIILIVFFFFHFFHFNFTDVNFQPEAGEFSY